MEGSVVWVNMFGELWRASVEQTREATTTEKLGVEVIAEDYSQMQERLRRGSHRAGFRDVTSEGPEDAGNEVDEEGRERGRPRVRFAGEPAESESDGGYSPSLAPADAAAASDQAADSLAVNEPDGGAVGVIPRRAEAIGSRLSLVAEPEAELQEPNAEDERQEMSKIEHLGEQVAQDDMASSVAENENLDGVPQAYEAVRRSVQRWRRRHETPYFAEFFFQEDDDDQRARNEPSEPKQDYWVYDQHRGVLQRHHVQWRRGLFNACTEEKPTHSTSWSRWT